MMQLFFLLLVLSKPQVIISFGFLALLFIYLLISGIRKTKKLNEENKRLMESIDMNIKETNETYRDFTESHLYNGDS